MYEFQWERHRPAIQKMVAMVIARGQARLRITAWGIIPIDLELFAKVSSGSKEQYRSCSRPLQISCLVGCQGILHRSSRTKGFHLGTDVTICKLFERDL